MGINDIEKLYKMCEEGIITKEEYLKAKTDILNSLDCNPPKPSIFTPTKNLPKGVGGLNWGAFCLPLLWSISHNTWIGLLCLIPDIGWIMSFVLLFKGNEWGWKNRHFSSVEEFQATQKAWMYWGIPIAIFGLIFIAMLIAVYIALVLI